MAEKHDGLVGYLQSEIRSAVSVGEYERVVRRLAGAHKMKVVATVGGQPQWLLVDGSEDAIVVTVTGVAKGSITSANVNTMMGFPAATVLYGNDKMAVAYVDVV